MALRQDVRASLPPTQPGRSIVSPHRILPVFTRISAVGSSPGTAGGDSKHNLAASRDDVPKAHIVERSRAKRCVGAPRWPCQSVVTASGNSGLCVSCALPLGQDQLQTTVPDRIRARNSENETLEGLTRIRDTGGKMSCISSQPPNERTPILAIACSGAIYNAIETFHNPGAAHAWSRLS